MTPSSSPDSYVDRAVLFASNCRLLPHTALRAVMKAVRLLGLANGVRLAQLRQSREPLLEVAADRDVHALHVQVFSQVIDILGQRWDKIPDRHRPQYTPHSRFRILQLKKLMCCSREETASTFRISPGTIARWEQEAEACPEKETVGSLLKPTPPLRRYADVVRHMVHNHALARIRGKQTGRPDLGPGRLEALEGVRQTSPQGNSSREVRP